VTSAPQKPVHLSLPYPPSVNDWKTTIVIAGRPRVLLTAKGREYRARVQTYAVLARPLQGPVRMTVRFYRPRRIGDVDGPLKSLLDALQGVAYDDDAQIAELHVYRLDDKLRPRADVEVESIAPEQHTSSASVPT
jgi:Holliday junction resolvase RusA-like endonuclease